MRLRWHIRVNCEPTDWIKCSLFIKIYVYTDINYWVDLLVHPCNLGVLVTELPSGRAVQCFTTTALKCIDRLRFDLFLVLHYKTSPVTNKPDEKKSRSWCLAVRIQDCKQVFIIWFTPNRQQAVCADFVTRLLLKFQFHDSLPARCALTWNRCGRENVIYLFFLFSSTVLLRVCSLGTM